jgi:hypothetical protein
MKYTILAFALILTFISCNGKKELKDNPDTEIVENFLISGKCI